MVLENVVYVLQHNCYRILLVMSLSYKKTIINCLHIHYNYSIDVMREKKKKTLEKNYRIKVDIECVFLFLLNTKTKYIFQTPTVNHITYKTHKSTTSNFNIKIVIAVVT